MASGSLLHDQLECGPGPVSTTLESEPISRRNAVLLIFPDVSMETTVFKPCWIKKHGVVFKKQDCYVVADSTQDGDPQFARLDEISVLASSTVLFFITVCWSTFDSHLHAYHITPQPTQTIICHDNLKDHSVYHGHKHEDSVYIIPKYKCT